MCIICSYIEINKRSKALAGNGFKKGWRIQAKLSNRMKNNVKAEMLLPFSWSKDSCIRHQTQGSRIFYKREAETLKRWFLFFTPTSGIYIVSPYWI